MIPVVQFVKLDPADRLWSLIFWPLFVVLGPLAVVADVASGRTHRSEALTGFAEWWCDAFFVIPWGILTGRGYLIPF